MYFHITVDFTSQLFLGKDNNKVNGFPFDLGNSPVTITVPVVGVKDWTLVDNRFTPALPKAVVSEERSDTVIELVPYGSTTLRLTIFPVLK